MTAPLTPEALVDLVARLRATNPWKKTAIAEDLMREAADSIQQVTAERDAAIKTCEMAATSGGFFAQHAKNSEARADAAEASLAATANAELARLRAEGEAKDRALTEIRDHPENYDDGRRSYTVGWAFWNIQNIARTALARAATAREG